MAENQTLLKSLLGKFKLYIQKVSSSETSVKLATAQGASLTNYEKCRLPLIPTRTMEQNKLLHKSFEQIFHKTDIKHNIVRIPFITKYIPTKNNLNSELHIKDKHTKLSITYLKFFQRLNKQPLFFQKKIFYHLYNQQRKHLKPLSGHVYNFFINQVHQYNIDKKKLYLSDLDFKPNQNFLQSKKFIYQIR